MPTSTVAELPRYCEQCGTPRVAGARFCETCGLAIGSPAPSLATAAVVPEAVVVSASAPPLRAPSSRTFHTAPIVAAFLVLVALGGWWWWTRAMAPDVAPSRAASSVSVPTPTVVDSIDVQYRDAKSRYDRAYTEYTRLMSTGGEGNVEVALREYRAAYAEWQRLDSLRKGRAP